MSLSVPIRLALFPHADVEAFLAQVISPLSVMPSPSSQCWDIFASHMESSDSECLFYLLIRPSILGFSLNAIRLSLSRLSVRGETRLPVTLSNLYSQVRLRKKELPSGAKVVAITLDQVFALFDIMSGRERARERGVSRCRRS
ncbi:hypothetical protein RJ641_020984 [Dillenia turbinata]|uniref:Uncharacterized protein n=1 Tax=Dillenia turbinata TaxID=194707 RepID=A0AAN8UN78_9MAGN